MKLTAAELPAVVAALSGGPLATGDRQPSNLYGCDQKRARAGDIAMRYSMTIHEQLYDDLQSHLFNRRDVERAGYLLCRLATGSTDTRLLPTEFIAVDDADIVSSSRLHMCIQSQSYLRALKLANEKRSCFVFVHSPPRRSAGPFAPR